MIKELENIKILAVDSSSLSGSVALCCGSTLVAESLLNIKSTHSEKLLKQIDLMLEEAGWTLDDLDLLAAVTGPGSFTGLRIGIAMVKGLAQVLDKPVVSVSALQTIAANVPLVSVPVCAFLDARKQEVYTQQFRWQDGIPQAIDEARVIAPQLLLNEINSETAFVGGGVSVYHEMISSHLGSQALIAPPIAHQLRASQAAWLALHSWSEGEAINPADMLPTYIRPSDAELNLSTKQSH